MVKTEAYYGAGGGQRPPLLRRSKKVEASEEGPQIVNSIGPNGHKAGETSPRSRISLALW